MSNATGGTFRAVVSDTDFSVAVGIIVALAVVSFLPLIAVIIRLAVSKAVQPMSKSMSASERLAHSRRAAKRSTLAVRGVSIALGWLLICWGWGPWILPRSVYVAPFFATPPAGASEGTAGGKTGSFHVVCAAHVVGRGVRVGHF